MLALTSHAPCLPSDNRHLSCRIPRVSTDMQSPTCIPRVAGSSDMQLSHGRCNTPSSHTSRYCAAECPIPSSAVADHHYRSTSPPYPSPGLLCPPAPSPRNRPRLTPYPSARTHTYVGMSSFDSRKCQPALQALGLPCLSTHPPLLSLFTPHFPHSPAILSH
jgi:hypothetical protein